MFQHIMNWTGMTADQIFQIITMIVAGVLGILTLRQQGRVKALEADATKVKSDADSQLKRVEAEAQGRLKQVEAEAQGRLETIENAQIKAQAEADQIRAMNANMEKLISGVFHQNQIAAQTDQKWQEVMNTISQRRVEADDKWLRANEKSDAIVERNTVAVNRLTEMLEIQSGQLGNLDTTVTAIGATVQGAVDEIKQRANENRNDFTSALALSVTERGSHQNSLSDIKNTIERLERTVMTALGKEEDKDNQILFAIHAQLKSIESKIADLIAPRPTVLGQAVGPGGIPLPAVKPAPEVPHKPNNEPDKKSA